MKIALLPVFIGALGGCASQEKGPEQVTAVIEYVQPQNDTVTRQLAPSSAKFRLQTGQDSAREQIWSAVAVKCDNVQLGCRQTLIKVTVHIERVDVDATGVIVQGQFVSDMGRKVEIYSGDKQNPSIRSTSEITAPGALLFEGIVSKPFKQHLRFDEDLLVEGPFGSKAIVRISTKKIEEMSE